MSLLSCLSNAITVEIYLDSVKKAKGELYLDDGETLDYKNTLSSHISFEYGDAGFTLQIWPGDWY